MTQNVNQFVQTPEKGFLDLQNGMNNVHNCQVSNSESGTVVAGEAVKLEDSAGGVPKVLKLAANTDKTFGFAVYNQKDTGFTAGMGVSIATNGTVMHMIAGAAIARGAKLEVVYSTGKIITNAGTNPVVGYALDKAAADGDVVRVLIGTPNTSF